MLDPVLSDAAVSLLCRLVDDGPLTLSEATDMPWFELLGDPRELVRGVLKSAPMPTTLGYASWAGKRLVLEWRDHARNLLR